MSKTVILLDMDGTITPARGRVQDDMLFCLIGAAQRADLAIVSGSDIDYMLEQCGNDFIEKGYAKTITLMPCNGTKVFKFSSKKGEYVEEFSLSIRDKLGDRGFRTLLSSISKAQAHMLAISDIDASGNFISDRDSTINWSLIGRDSTWDVRKKFTSREDNMSIRLEAIELLISYMKSKLANKLDVVVAGETSIDIYPKGWDKTFALGHFKDGEKVFFIGDRCEVGQNDFHIYQALRGGNASFKTSGPKETIFILDAIVDSLIEELSDEFVDYDHDPEAEFVDAIVTLADELIVEGDGYADAVSDITEIEDAFFELFEEKESAEDGESVEESIVKSPGLWQRFVELVKSWWYKLTGDKS
jgi:phosphomannomutase